ncbi:MAG: hypothetical protein COB22_06825 [Cycloclasticus sp.]|nr:MAG: hypothetical protein COB22_06825 [Cycloclasticus sp.]
MPYLKTLLFVILLNISVSLPVLAGDSVIILAKADHVTLDEAVNRVKKQKKGKVLGAETLQIDGQPTHVIKVLTNEGRVKKIRLKSTPNK